MSINQDFGRGAYVGVRSVISLYANGVVGLEAVRSALDWDGEDGALEWGVKWGLLTKEEVREIRRERERS